MKNFPLALAGLLLLGGVFSTPAASTDARPPEPRLTVELRDGSRVVGTALAKDVQFHSALFGEIKLAVGDIHSVECGATNAARLVTTGGDTLTVGFEDSDLALQTSFGKVDLAVTSIRKFTVATAGAGGARRPGLVALWSGEGDGKDSVGGHDAELTDITFADGKVGQAFALNGYSSWANIPASRNPGQAIADGLTISAWIKPFDVNSFHPIMEWEVTRQKNAVSLWIGHLPQDQGVLAGNIADTEGNNHPIISPPGTLVAGQFQYIALTYDKASGFSRLLVNGRIVAEENIGSVTPDTTGPLFISRRPHDQLGDWTYDKFFSGLLDELEIYDRALSPEEIRAICTEQNHGEDLPMPATWRSRNLPSQ